MSTCAICVEDTETPACCVPCGHVYCRECIDNWQKSNKSVSKCPECREEIQNVMAIYIKQDDSKDEVKLLAKRLELLQSTLSDCNLAKTQLENDLKESIKTFKEEQERINNQLDKQIEQTNSYKDKWHTCLNEKKNLQKKIQSMAKREEKIMNKCEISLIEEREKTRKWIDKHKRLQDSLTKKALEIKTLEGTIGELKDEIREQKDRWMMKFIKGTEKVKMMLAFLATMLTIIEKKFVHYLKVLGWMCFFVSVTFFVCCASYLIRYSSENELTMSQKQEIVFLTFIVIIVVVPFFPRDHYEFLEVHGVLRRQRNFLVFHDRSSHRLLVKELIPMVKHAESMLQNTTEH